MIDYNGTGKDKESIISCAAMILSTVRGSMPYMRDMGISDEILGRNSPYAEDAFISDAVDQIETWDERVVVREIQMEDSGGNLETKVVLEDGE